MEYDNECSASGPTLTLRHRSTFIPSDAYDLPEDAIAELRVTTSSRTTVVESWEEAMPLLKDHEEDVAQIMRGEEAASLLLILTAAAGLHRVISGGRLFEFLDPGLLTPRRELLPKYTTGKLIFHTYHLHGFSPTLASQPGTKARAVIQRVIWDIRAATLSTVETVAILDTSDDAGEGEGE